MRKEIHSGGAFARSAEKTIISALSSSSFGAPSLALEAGVSLPNARRIADYLCRRGFLLCEESRGTKKYTNCENILFAIMNMDSEFIRMRILTRHGEQKESLSYRINGGLEYESCAKGFCEKASELIAPYIEAGHFFGSAAICRESCALACEGELCALFGSCEAMSEVECIAEYLRAKYISGEVLCASIGRGISFRLYSDGEPLDTPDISEIPLVHTDSEEIERLVFERVFSLRRLLRLRAVVIDAQGVELPADFGESLSRQISRGCNLFGDELPEILFDGEIGIAERSALICAQKSFARRIESELRRGV